MDGGEHKAFRRQLVVAEDRADAVRPRGRPERDVEHHIAGLETFSTIPSFLDCQPRFCGAEEQGRKAVGHDPVDFFRHAAVKAPKARLDMRQRVSVI